MTPQPQPFSPGQRAQRAVANGPIFGLDWSPDGRTLATSAYAQARLWDLEGLEETVVLIGHSHFIWSLAWAPDGSRLATAGQDGAVKLWDPAAWENPASLETGWAFCVAWSPDGKHLAAGIGAYSDPTNPETFSGAIHIWDAATRQQLCEFIGSSFILSLAWSPDGRSLAAGQLDGKITLWEGILDGETAPPQKSLVATSARSDVNGLAWSPDGQMLAAAQQDGQVRIWDPQAATICQTLSGHKGWLRGLAWSPGGEMLASAGENAEILVWRSQDGQELACWLPGSLPIWSLKWSADGKYLAAGDGLLAEQLHDSNLFIYQMPVYAA